MRRSYFNHHGEQLTPNEIADELDEETFASHHGHPTSCTCTGCDGDALRAVRSEILPETEVGRRVEKTRLLLVRGLTIIDRLLAGKAVR